MNTKTGILVLKYLLIWLGLSTAYFFASEQITKWIVPGFDGIAIWLFVLTVGLILIFIVVLNLFLINIRKHKKS
jgi:hypothetical protein